MEIFTILNFRLMRKLVILFLTVLIGSCSNSKTSCEIDFNISQDSVVVDSIVVKERLFKYLSHTHNFKLTFFEYYRDNWAQEPYWGDWFSEHYWKIIIYDKKMNVVDSIHQPVHVLFSESIFEGTDFYRSYITGINQNKEVVDNYHGDFIVADFNFDSKNDFAIINDIGGNGGPFYSYYIQQNDNKFVLDTFLTDSMVYFPTKIDIKNRQLTTYIHAGVCWMGAHIYKLDKTNKWKEISNRIIDVCEE